MKKFAFLAALWWLLISGSLGVLLIAAAPRSQRQSMSENRMLAGAPVLTAGTFFDGSFADGADAFLSDGFFARDAVISCAQSLISVFDLRTEDERFAEEAEETDRLLREDAGEELSLLRWLIPSACAEEKAALPADAQYHLTLHFRSREDSVVYTYRAEDLTAFAGTLNTLRSLLGEDGEVHFVQVPVAAVGRRLIQGNGVSWESDMEPALQSQVADGVTIHNAVADLNEPLMRHERCYFFTDHHWTDLGAWYVAAEIAESRGYPAIPYDEYTYSDRKIGQDGQFDDVARLLTPLLPTHSYVVTHRTEAHEIDFMNLKVRTYTAYINNTRTPWRVFTGNYGSSRKALLLSDSFGNALLPYLLPYYGEVDMTDLRSTYFDPKEAGGTFRELVAFHDIDDIYVVYSTSSGVPSANAMKILPAELAK